MDQGLQKYELCLARQAGMLGEWDYCMQVKTIFGGLDAISAATRCDQEAALLVPAAATAAAPKIQTTQIEKSPASTAWRHRTPLLVGTAISVVGAGVMYALAASEHSQFLASPTMGHSEAEASGYRTELEGMQARANAFSYAAYGASGLGVVLGLGAVITW